MSRLLEFVLGDVLFGEVAKGRMWVFRCVWVLPRLVGFIVLPSEDVLQLIFAWMERGVHWICEARLSRRSELAMELCCSLGSMVSYKNNA